MSDLHPWAGTKRLADWTWQKECEYLVRRINLHRADTAREDQVVADALLDVAIVDYVRDPDFKKWFESE